jgi:hypothetical protein
MAHNNHHDSSEEPPVYGLMTRTLVQSPVIRQIIPARIRSKDLNDVVFIGVGSALAVKHMALMLLCLSAKTVEIY